MEGSAAVIKIYADVVFFINLFMDFFIFWITGKLIKVKTSNIHIFLGSLVTAVLYCVILFVPILNRFYNFFGAVFVLSVGIGIAFRPKKWKTFLLLLFFSHISAFAVGGTAMALFYCFNFFPFVGENVGISRSHFSLKLLLFSTAAIYIILKIGTVWIQTNIIDRKSYCNLKIFFEGKEEQFTALIDTGNLLSDPFTGNTVIVAEFTKIQKFFSPEIRLAFYENAELNFEILLEKYKEEAVFKKVRFIPFCSLGKKNGMLLGFQSDKAEAYWKEKNLVIENPIIAVYQNHLSKSGVYHGLVNPEIFQQ